MSQSKRASRAESTPSLTRSRRRRPCSGSGWYDQYCEGVPVDMNHFRLYLELALSFAPGPGKRPSPEKPFRLAYFDARPRSRPQAERTDVPSARFTARNSTFRSANRMLRTFRHEDSVTFRETRNRWFIRIKKSQTRTPTPHAGFGTLTEQSPQGERCELLQEATSSVSA